MTFVEIVIVLQYLYGNNCFCMVLFNLTSHVTVHYIELDFSGTFLYCLYCIQTTVKC